MKYLIILLSILLIPTSANAGVPYKTIDTGMLFLLKSDAQSFYSLAMDQDKQAQMTLMTECTIKSTCILIDAGTDIFLEQQAEYPLIELRIKGRTQKYWALNNIIKLD